MTPSPSDIDSLRPALRALPGTPGPITPLPSGSGGRSWLVETGSGRYVAKVFKADAPLLLGPARQFELLRMLAAAGIAPEPAGFDAAARMLITEYVDDAAAVPAAELGRPARLREAAALLRRLHAVPAEVPAFAPIDYAERYLEALGGRMRLAPEDRRRHDELLELVAWPLPGAPCLCHNDLLADNLLLGSRPRLIDFDYAVTATPVVDLASLVIMNGFDRDTSAVLLDSYFGGSVPFSPDEFARVQRLECLLAHFWSLAAAADDADIVARYRIRDD